MHVSEPLEAWLCESRMRREREREGESEEDGGGVSLDYATGCLSLVTSRVHPVFTGWLEVRIAVRIARWGSSPAEDVSRELRCILQLFS